jgi:hypothetical protein
LPNNLPTAAGPSNNPVAQDKNGQENQAQEKRSAMIDALNQVFTLFRLNYHNQYLKAFGNAAEVNEVKRLWLEMLRQFDAATLLAAAKSVIESSEYLPTLRTMILHCERASRSPQLPDAHSAYLEACLAPSPKAAFDWSHPAVYHAGQRCDWFFLQTQAEVVAFPVFREIYEEFCQQVRRGVDLAKPLAPALPEPVTEPLPCAQNQQKLKALRESLNI